MHKIKWNDLQILMAVAEHGSASSAAVALGLNHSTVLRRVTAFEALQGVQLFERRASGYSPTAAGRALVTAARGIADAVLDIERDILGQDQKLSGEIVVTTTDTIVSSVLPRHLASFHTAHPDITVTLAMTNARLDLARLDADIAIRPSRNPPETLLGRRISGLAFAIYGHPEQAASQPFETDDIVPWLGGSNTLLNSPIAQWMEEHIDRDKVTARADSFVALAAMVEAGLGISILPCCLGDARPALRRLTPPVPELETSLWILSHRDLRNTARVRALTEHLAKGLTTDRPKLEGRASPARGEAARERERRGKP